MRAAYKDQHKNYCSGAGRKDHLYILLITYTTFCGYIIVLTRIVHVIWIYRNRWLLNVLFILTDSLILTLADDPRWLRS